RILIQITSFVIVSDDHPDVLVSSHALHLAIGEAQTERPGDGRAPQIVRRKRLLGFIEPGKPGPAVDDLANVPGRERPIEFERSVVDDRLEDESIIAVAVEIPPAAGVQFQVVVDRLFDVLWEGNRSFATSFDLDPRCPAPVTPNDRGNPQISDLT